MQRRRSRLSYVALAAAFTFMQVGRATAADAFDIGIVNSLTGVTAVAGTANLCGANIAARTVNETGGIDGRPVVLHAEDDQSRPASASQAATKLTALGIKYFVGGASSNTVLAEIPVFKDAGSLFLGGTAKADQVLQSGGLVVRLNSNNAQDGAIIADYVSKTLHAKVIDEVSLQGAYGQGALASINKALAPGVTVKNTAFAPAEAANFQSILTSIAADQPDAVVWAMYGDSQPVAFMRQFKQFAIKAHSVAGAGTLTASLVKAAGGAADGLISADIWVDGLRTPANDALKAAFDKHKAQVPACAGVPLDKQVAITYSQVLLLSMAVAQAKSSEPGKLRDTIVHGTWDLPQGEVKFDPDGQARAQYHMIQVKGETIGALE